MVYDPSSTMKLPSTKTQADPVEAATSKALWLLLIVVTLLRLGLLAGPVGFSTGDDVEILQTALAPVLGFEDQPWNIRNLLLPKALGTPIAWLAAEIFGIRDPEWLIRIATLPFLVLATLNVFLVFCIGRALFDSASGLVAAGLYGLHWLPLGYGAMAYPRTAAVSCLLIAWIVLLDERPRVWNAFWAGGLAALAFAFRYSEVVFLLPVGLLPWAMGKPTRQVVRSTTWLGGGFLAGCVLTVGLMDGLTWGFPFASLVEFGRYTLVERQASSAEVHQPWYWYLSRGAFWLIPTWLIFLGHRPQRGRTLGAWLWLVLPLLALSFVHHKQLRYLQGLIPAFALLVAWGAVRWWRQGRRVAVVVLVTAGLLFSLRSAWRLLERRSQAAVSAARELRHEPCARRVVLRQAWAYGGRLLLDPGTEIRDFDRMPAPDEFAAALPNVDFVGLYAADLTADARLAEVLAGAGFTADASHSAPGSLEVRLYRSNRACP